MQHALYFWVERYLFNPNLFQKLLSFALLPLSAIYCLIMIVKRKKRDAKDFHIPIISIGNLIVGGSGKTPVTIALAQKYRDAFIILRGYKRESHGLIMISDKGRILEDIHTSGDEAMLYATTLPKASVIVSEDRVKAIEKAKTLGAKVIFLDDGFSKSHIQKLDILIKPPLPHANNFCLPSGPYRERKSLYHDNLTIEEEVDFKRHVTILNPSKKMVLVTAISKPERLNAFIPKELPKVIYPDHATFTKASLEAIMIKYQATSILTTQKDAVKIQEFGLPLSILALDIMIEADIIHIVDTFIENFGKISQK
jgi:tetraacyldisaccharide 4'-kinase